MTTKLLNLVLILAICSTFVICNAGGPKKQNFYKKNDVRDNYYAEHCPRAEEVVQSITEKHVLSNPSLPAKLIRVLFHDCFVRGCDGSVLLDSTPNFQSEKEAIPNRGLSGFDVINEIKATLENECPEIVSCADILTLATRDAVSFQYGRPLWKVPTGRRDGTISLASEVLGNIPSPFSNFTVLKNDFERKGLSIADLVALSGAHTIGVGHCNLFSRRLFNFTGNNDQDPSLNPKYANFLRSQCEGPNDRTTTVEMDPGSSLSFDNHYFQILREDKGLFVSDATLLTNKKARKFTKKLLNPKKFFDEFAKSMEKMGVIEVLTGTQGEIRKQCNFVNNN
ncbi:Peroxidase 3 [Bienertia sinuspersici]